MSAGKINVQQQRYRFMCVLVHLGCDQPLPQKSAHLWTRTCPSLDTNEFVSNDVKIGLFSFENHF